MEVLNLNLGKAILKYFGIALFIIVISGNKQQILSSFTVLK